MTDLAIHVFTAPKAEVASFFSMRLPRKKSCTMLTSSKLAQLDWRSL